MKDNKRTWSDSSYQMLIALWRTVSTPFRWIKGYLTRALYTSEKQISNSQLPTWLPFASTLGVPPYMTSPPKNTLSNSKAKITRAVQTSSGFLKKPTLPDDTDSDPTLELFLSSILTCEPLISTSRTRRAPTSLELDRMPLMYPPRPRLQLEQISGCLSISSTPPRSPRQLQGPSQR